MIFLIILLLVIFIFNVNGIFFALTGNISVISPFILVLLSLVIILLYKNKLLKLSIKISGMWILLLITYLSIGLISLILFQYYGEKVMLSIRDVITTIIILISFSGGIYYLIFQYGERKILLLFSLILFSSALSIILLKFFGLDYIFNPKSYFYRQSGFFGNPNEAGRLCAFSILFILFFLSNFKNGKFIQILFFFFLIIITYASIVTFSKASIICSIILYFLIFITTVRKNIPTYLFISIISFGAFIYISTNLDINFDRGQLKRLEGVGQLFSGDINQESTTDRTSYAKIGWNYIADYPIGGIGLGNFKSLPYINSAVHNTFFVFWGESGIIPFILYLYLIASFFYNGIKFYFKFKSPTLTFLNIGFGVIILIYSFSTSNLFEDRVFNSALIFTLVINYINKDIKENLNV
ncbi:hypothetical protein P872_21540 [Rhodonellum psychrophilum GCM71 = DSM 17998]|uniref:O-antigen ligase-related domain-containing protein n=2 Tax=Rhodonellum TaxID=336827 RepID=U5BJR5_9BACT|nr:MULTISPECIES: O-antigen ligase family protein [Rhodonellum]ERM80690.1 hypothetical protein P872_21540 [Rhodonellum psychrophilum GCM71 = DSM 17998]SDZ06687.1 O-Antigen ligase [Rhodonellum ikkaensis]